MYFELLKIKIHFSQIMQTSKLSREKKVADFSTYLYICMYVCIASNHFFIYALVLKKKKKTLFN
jgi:hypothetical protein